MGNLDKVGLSKSKLEVKCVAQEIEIQNLNLQARTDKQRIYSYEREGMKKKQRTALSPPPLQARDDLSLVAERDIRRAVLSLTN